MKVTLDKDAYMPEYAHSTDSGMDLRTREDFVLPAHGHYSVDTGVHIEVPPGCTGFLKSKSGLNVKHNIISEGVIDEGYTGPIVVRLHNLGDEDYHFSKGDKVTQLVILPVFQVKLDLVETLDDTDRGESGFGSTGK